MEEIPSGDMRDVIDETTRPDLLMERDDLAYQVSLILRSAEREKDAEVIRLRYGLDGRDPHTLKALGQCYGVTQERARQILAKAHNKLFGPKRFKKVRDYSHRPLSPIEWIAAEQEKAKNGTITRQNYPKYTRGEGPRTHRVALQRILDDAKARASCGSDYHGDRLMIKDLEKQLGIQK